MNQQNKQQKFIKEWIEICKTEEEISSKKRKMEEEEKENMATKKQKMVDEIMKGMNENYEEIGKLKKENDALKFKQARMKAYLRKANLSISRYILPFELMNEIFGSLPVKNAFGLLTKMPNGLLARNVQKLINDIKMVIKNNKWNEKDSGHLLALIDDGLTIVNSGLNERNCVRAILPIPALKLATNKSIISSYFEVQITKKTGNYGIAIGFCTHQEATMKKGQWPAVQWPGFVKNSIGIVEKGGICIDDTVTEFESAYGYFMNGDVVGIGIIHCPANSSMKCFATWNGQLLGKIELPQKFANLQLFPAIGFKHNGDSIRANFGKEEWIFKQFNQLLTQLKET